MVIVIPLTRLIAGKAIGTTAALVPLTISAIPFVARVIESALRSVDVGLIEAAKSFGASDFQIIYRIYLKEAIPAILSGITLTMISIIGYSAMGGALGAGGLGDIAIRYGGDEFVIITNYSSKDLSTKITDEVFSFLNTHIPQVIIKIRNDSLNFFGFYV